MCQCAERNRSFVSLLGDKSIKVKEEAFGSFGIQQAIVDDNDVPVIHAPDTHASLGTAIFLPVPTDDPTDFAAGRRMDGLLGTQPAIAGFRLIADVARLDQNQIGAIVGKRRMAGGRWRRCPRSAHD